MKRILTILLSVMMVMSVFTLNVFADDVADIDFKISGEVSTLEDDFILVDQPESVLYEKAEEFYDIDVEDTGLIPSFWYYDGGYRWVEHDSTRKITADSHYFITFYDHNGHVSGEEEYSDYTVTTKNGTTGTNEVNQAFTVVRPVANITYNVYAQTSALLGKKESEFYNPENASLFYSIDVENSGLIPSFFKDSGSGYAYVDPSSTSDILSGNKYMVQFYDCNNYAVNYVPYLVQIAEGSRGTNVKPDTTNRARMEFTIVPTVKITYDETFKLETGRLTGEQLYKLLEDAYTIENNNAAGLIPSIHKRNGSSYTYVDNNSSPITLADSEVYAISFYDFNQKKTDTGSSNYVYYLVESDGGYERISRDNDYGKAVSLDVTVYQPTANVTFTIPEKSNTLLNHKESELYDEKNAKLFYSLDEDDTDLIPSFHKYVDGEWKYVDRNSDELISNGSKYRISFYDHNGHLNDASHEEYVNYFVENVNGYVRVERSNSQDNVVSFDFTIRKSKPKTDYTIPVTGIE